jgi:hypothetical protein
MKRLALAALFILLTSGCATLLASRHRNVPFRSDPPGAEVWIDGRLRGKTPLRVWLRHGTDYQVVFKMAGYPDRLRVMRNDLEEGWLVLDILFGLVPVVIDGATNSWSYLIDRDLSVDLRTGIESRVPYVGTPSPPPAGSAPLVAVKLKPAAGGGVIGAKSVGPGSFGTVKLLLPDGSERFIDAVFIESIVVADGEDLLNAVVEGARTVTP